jgi:hypothetical protein
MTSPESTPTYLPWKTFFNARHTRYSAGRLLRPNPKKNMVYGRRATMPELTITSPYVHSTVNSNIFTMENRMPESTLTLCQSQLYPPPVRNFGFNLYTVREDFERFRVVRQSSLLCLHAVMRVRLPFDVILLEQPAEPVCLVSVCMHIKADYLAPPKRPLSFPNAVIY